MQNVQITIEALVKANVEKAWDCYMQPQHITQWNFADPSWQCPSAENNMQVGGQYKARMEAKDGSFGFDFEAIYEAINPPTGFSYRLGDNRLVTASFEPKENETLVRIVFDAETENPIEMQRGGWQAILNNYKHYTESL
jgi:uncharacterized protein YndB with AHSA1/START domain